MLKYIFFAGLFAFALVSCEQKKENSDTESTQAEVKSEIPWSKGEKITEAVDNYYNENVYDKGKETLTLDNNGNPLEASISKINKDNVMLTSEKEGVVEVNMRGAAEEEIIADFFLAWDANRPASTDSIPGGFVVKSVALRELKGEKRYSWEKEGNFFVKK
jgi:archaellum component FlaD/FlaE